MALPAIIGVDKEKCINCHQCIAHCPVKFCIDGSGETIEINHEMCIGCGACIDACMHDARYIIDDWSRFIEGTEKRQEMIAIVAPAVAASYGMNMLRINGFLKELGVSAFFDVSFGAELTVKSYLEHYKKNNPRMIIAQPCPAIVNYIEIYKPELIPYLAPADSPMLHIIKMIRKYYPQYSQAKIVIVSPCIAKRREFDSTGLGDYNITFDSISEYLDSHNKKLERYPEIEFISPLPERAVLFSSPGGLKETLKREAPHLAPKVRKIEGPSQIYPYLSELSDIIEKKKNPLVIDCLSCEKGCNGGTGTRVRNESVDILESRIQERANKLKKGSFGNKQDNKVSKKLNKVLDKYWESGLFDRKYKDRSGNSKITIPDEQEKWKIFNKMHKWNEDDIYNCSSCGYGSCTDMATAIHNGLNRVENCHHYQIDLIQKSKDKSIKLSQQVFDKVVEAGQAMDTVMSFVEGMKLSTGNQVAAVQQSSSAIEEMVGSIQSINNLVNQRHDMVVSLQEDTNIGSQTVSKNMESVGRVFESIEKIQMVNETINSVASSTNLLSMNAAIEAAHAGNAGNGFSVVAEEIRKLAEETAENAQIISSDLATISQEAGLSHSSSQESARLMNDIVTRLETLTKSFDELSMTMKEMSTGTLQISEALDNILQGSRDVDTKSAELGEVVQKVHECYREIKHLSNESSHLFSEDAG